MSHSILQFNSTVFPLKVVYINGQKNHRTSFLCAESVSVDTVTLDCGSPLEQILVSFIFLITFTSGTHRVNGAYEFFLEPALVVI